MAYQLFPLLCMFQVTTVKYRHWLSALHQFSQAQCILLSSQQQQAAAATSPHIISALCRASAVIYDAMMLAKVSPTIAMLNSVDANIEDLPHPQ